MTLDWSNVNHFAPGEFVCKCGCGAGEDTMQGDFVYRLDRARGLAGVSFAITSGYRCPRHNAEIGGVSSSSHVNGWAADIACGGSRSRATIVTAAIEAGFNRIGIAKDFIHLDADPDKPERVFWVY